MGSLSDVYETQIEFYDKNGVLLEKIETDINGSLADNVDDFYKGAFLTGYITADADYYKVYTKNAEVKYFLFQDDVEVIKTKQAEKYQIVPEVLYDGIGNGNVISIEAERSEKLEARILYRLESPEDQSSSNYYALEVESLSEDDLAIGLILFDSAGMDASRYYTHLKSGKNLILFSELGFSNINRLENIAEIDLRIYTTELTEEIRIVLGDLYKFDSVTDLYDYMNGSEFIINPQ